MKLLRYGFLLLVLLGIHEDSLSQREITLEDDRDVLIQKLKEECPLLTGYSEEECGFYSDDFRDNVVSAVVYVQGMIQTWRLGANSNFYESTEQELKDYESGLVSEPSQDYITEYYHLLLKKAAIKPQAADTEFVKIVRHWVGDPLGHAVVPDLKQSKAWFAFQTVLFRLLDERFGEESNYDRWVVWARYQAHATEVSSLYDLLYDLLDVSYSGLEAEKTLFRISDSLINEIRPFTTKTKLDQRRADWANRRILFIEEETGGEFDEEEFEYLAQRYELVAKDVPDDYSIMYNTGRFIYNRSVEIVDSIDVSASDEKLDALTQQVKSLMTRALPYLERAKELDGEGE